MLNLASKISGLLSELNKTISQNLLDKDGYIIPEEIDSVLSDKNPAHDFLVYFLKNENFKIKCSKLEDFFFSLDPLTKILSSEQIVSKVSPNPDTLKDELFKIESLDMEEFFKTLPIGFEITIDLISKNLSNKDLINFLNRLEALDQIILPRKFTHFKKIKDTLNYSIERGNLEEYGPAVQLINKNEKLFPLLYRKIQTTFRINDYITLRLENNQTNIYVKGKIFNQCKFLLINIPTNKTKEYKKVNSIDEAIEVNNLNGALEGRGKSQYTITPKEEFRGHCSNIQVWAENDYDTCILHRNLAFPLLHKLAEVGDPLAKKKFKQEVLKRLVSGHSTVITYLAENGYLKHGNITDEDYFEIFKNAQSDFIENLIRGLANPKYSRFIEPIFTKFMKYFQRETENDFKEFIIKMLENVDNELYSGIMRAKFLESIDRKIITELLNKQSCNLKEYFYKFRGKGFFISHNGEIKLDNKGINDLREIEGLHRLRSLKILDLRDNNLTDIFGLEKLNNLKTLRLKGNLLTQRLLEKLGGLDEKGDAKYPQKFVEYCKVNAYHQIEIINVYNTKYDVINGRLNLSKLGINELSDIEGLFELKNLTHLDLSYNNLKNVEAIQLLTSLESLYLSHNKITEVCNLEALTKLKEIRLNDNKILSKKKMPNLKNYGKNLPLIDLDTPRNVEDREYLFYLLQSLNVSDMISLCRQFNVRRHSKLTKEKLIEFIPQALLEYETRDMIKVLERKIISRGIEDAVLSLRKVTSPSNFKKVQVSFLDNSLIQIVTTNFDKRQVKSTLRITPSNLDNPQRHCECKIGRKKGFCTHFWYGVIFSLKRGIFQLSNWTLTILPANLEKLIEPIQVNEIAPNEYLFINKESLIHDAKVEVKTNKRQMNGMGYKEFKEIFNDSYKKLNKS